MAPSKRRLPVHPSASSSFAPCLITGPPCAPCLTTDPLSCCSGARQISAGLAGGYRPVLRHLEASRRRTSSVSPLCCHPPLVNTLFSSDSWCYRPAESALVQALREPLLWPPCPYGLPSWLALMACPHGLQAATCSGTSRTRAGAHTLGQDSTGPAACVHAEQN